MRVLVLDDDRDRLRFFTSAFKDDVDLAMVADEAIKMLGEREYGAIFLDHDLLPHHYAVLLLDPAPADMDRETGYAVADWLAKHPEASPEARITVHTQNERAGWRMATTLRAGGRVRVQVAPFPILAAWHKRAILDGWG